MELFIYLHCQSPSSVIKVIESFSVSPPRSFFSSTLVPKNLKEEVIDKRTKTEEVDPYGLYLYGICFLEKFKSSKRTSTNKWKFAIMEIHGNLVSFETRN